MQTKLSEILSKTKHSKADIIYMLSTEGDEKNRLFRHAGEIKNAIVGNKVYLRGLIEYSNICFKDCLYCGIRNSNKEVQRYVLNSNDIDAACKFAINMNIGSVVLQCGEQQSNKFAENITSVIQQIKAFSKDIRITLSCGEQSAEVYKQWFEAGAERYLLRIESSSPDLYEKIHPMDGKHAFHERLKCLYAIKNTGYQTGTGVMIGMPFQTIEDLADDILFMKSMDIDMCGMGPYIEHHQVPLCKIHNNFSTDARYQLTLKMIAILRIVMQNINIASTTAMQTLNKRGKTNALEAGANVIMPNITPQRAKAFYHLYENKPGSNLHETDEYKQTLLAIKSSGCIAAIGEQGDSLHFLTK